MARQRNNISRLNSEQRIFVCDWLCDGLPYQEIRARLASILKGAANEGMAFHGSTFLAYQKSDEFKLYRDRKMKITEKTHPQFIDAAIINGGRGIESAADVAALDLLSQIRELSGGGGLEVKDIHMLVQNVVSLKRNSVSSKEKAMQAEIAERDETIKSLKAEIASLREQLTGSAEADPKQIADALDKALGVR